MLLSMLVKLYNQQQLELEQQQQQHQQRQLQQPSPMGQLSPSSLSAELQQQPDDQTLAAVMAAKQLLELQNFGRHQQQQQPSQQQIQMKKEQELQQQHQQMLQFHQQQLLRSQQQQPLHQLNHFGGAPQQQQQQAQQQQPFDLSVKSSLNSSLNNSTGTTANSPQQQQQQQLSVSQHLASQHFQLQLAAAALGNNGQHSPLSSHSDDPRFHETEQNMELLDETDEHRHAHCSDDDDNDSLDLVKRDSGARSVTPIGLSKSIDGEDAPQKPQPFKIIRDKDNNFVCQYCSKKYQSLGALKMHVRTHTLPCQCKLCGKSFSRPWLLQGHIRTHTGEKPFKCDQCDRAFADRSNLRAHLQTHAKIKKYSCKFCLKTFSRMSLQNKHEEHCNIHSQQTNQQTSLTPSNVVSEPLIRDCSSAGSNSSNQAPYV